MPFTVYGDLKPIIEAWVLYFRHIANTRSISLPIIIRKNRWQMMPDWSWQKKKKTANKADNRIYDKERKLDAGFSEDSDFLLLYGKFFAGEQESNEYEKQEIQRMKKETSS